MLILGTSLTPLGKVLVVHGQCLKVERLAGKSKEKGQVTGCHARRSQDYASDLGPFYSAWAESGHPRDYYRTRNRGIILDDRFGIAQASCTEADPARSLAILLYWGQPLQL
jgi:hypothetical protein